MRRRVRAGWIALAGLAALTGAPARAQAPAEEGGAPAEAAPKPKPARRPAPVKAPVPAAGVRPPDLKPPAAPEPDALRAEPTFAANLTDLTVLCADKAALFASEAVSVWVTRSGTIVVDNPLRPLTPETTRVLQVVIGGKVATAYGQDLSALRRGGTPAALEATTGGPVRWDGAVTALPDTLTIVSEAGEPLARLGFRECGTAPAATVRAPPARKPAGRDTAKPEAKPEARSEAKPEAKPGARPAAAAKAPPGFQLPQGAIP